MGRIFFEKNHKKHFTKRLPLVYIIVKHGKRLTLSDKNPLIFSFLEND